LSVRKSGLAIWEGKTPSEAGPSAKKRETVSLFKGTQAAVLGAISLGGVPFDVCVLSATKTLVLHDPSSTTGVISSASIASDPSLRAFFPGSRPPGYNARLLSPFLHWRTTPFPLYFYERWVFVFSHFVILWGSALFVEEVFPPFGNVLLSFRPACNFLIFLVIPPSWNFDLFLDNVS